MRVQTEEWRRFTPGVRMYKSKKTLFYNGERLYHLRPRELLIHDEEERQTWEAIIVLPGVGIIPEFTFFGCKNVEQVIMSNSVRRIEHGAFCFCRKLAFVKLSTVLAYIGSCAFASCEMTSIFIPPSCNEIRDAAFKFCRKLIIISVPQHTQLGRFVISYTALYWVSPFLGRNREEFLNQNNQLNDWIKNINIEEQYALHRACSSFNPMEVIIYGVVQREKSLMVFKRRNSIGITPLQYLEANPYADIDQKKFIKRFVLEMMEEIAL